MRNIKNLSRRDFISTGTALAATALPLGIGACSTDESVVETTPAVSAVTEGMIKRAIPGTDEYLSAVGMGSPDAFINLPEDGKELPISLIKTMMEYGGNIIDAPAFFRQPEDPVLGSLLTEMNLQKDLFLTGKITVRGKQEGIAHIERISNYLNKKPMDLLMVHNMRQLETHWPTLKQWKEEGKVRYIGVSRTRTTDFTELETFMRNEKPDFLLIGYSIYQQVPAERVLPLAQDLGVAVIGAEAFKAKDDGAFFSIVAGKPIPEWAAEYGIDTWAQYSLKYILSNPAMTTVVVETSKVKHVIDNMRGGYGRLPDEATRNRMSEHLLSL